MNEPAAASPDGGPRLLTAELEGRILAAIRAGGFPHVAAAAFGVPPRLLRKWLRRRSKGDIANSFGQKVAQAQATARLAAEMQIHQKDPRLWLRAGPGRETPDAIGWTTFVRPQLIKTETVDLPTAPGFLQLIAILQVALAPYPEALQAVTQAMASRKEPPRQLL